MKNNPYKKYKETAIQSASREKLLLLMYEGAIKFVKRAIEAAEKKEIAERGLNIGRAYDVIMELNNTLDHKVGGAIAVQLEQLYNFITDELVKANVNGDVKHLKNALKILDTLYQGWVQAVEQMKTKDTQNSSPAKGGP